MTQKPERNVENDFKAMQILDKIMPQLPHTFHLSDIVRHKIAFSDPSYGNLYLLFDDLLNEHGYINQVRGYLYKLSDTAKEVIRKGGHCKLYPAVEEIHNGTANNYMDQFTAVNKDTLLTLLTDQLPPGRYVRLNNSELTKESGLDEEVMDTILTQFHELGFINYDGLSSTTCALTVKAEAYDFRRQGGFYIREIVILGQLTKLYEEFTYLQKADSGTILERMSHMATIMAGLIAIAKSNSN